MTKYRGPWVAGWVLFALTWVWAWGEWRAVGEREEDAVIRHAQSLGRGLSVLVATDASPAPIKSALESHLQLHPPLMGAVVERDEVEVARMGPESDPEVGVWVCVPLTRDESVCPADGSGFHHPWSWESEPGPWRLLVQMDARLPPPLLHAMLGRLARMLTLAWVAIAMLVLAWVRSVRSRDLAAALAGEHRERARLTEMNLMAAGLAHETRNPLGLILGMAHRLAESSPPDSLAHETAEDIMDEADRATARLGDFLNFARVREPRIEVVDLKGVLERVTRALRPDFGDTALVLEVDAGKIWCDAGMLEQVCVNLLLNSARASGEGGVTTVRCEIDGVRAWICVEDQGCGVPEALRETLFQPYVTGREDGHGLGLAMVHRIVTQHGWEIEVESEEGVGTVVRIHGIEVVHVG